MRKISALILALTLLLFAFAVSGCSKKEETNDNTTAVTEDQNDKKGPVMPTVVHPSGFESYVPDGSAIIGLWKETTKHDGFHYEWNFFAKNGEHTQLHYIMCRDTGTSSREVGYYNFNEETGVLECYFASKQETETTLYNVKISGNKMTLTPQAGGEVINLIKG